MSLMIRLGRSDKQNQVEVHLFQGEGKNAPDPLKAEIDNSYPVN
jgi:hypothetical protein